MESKNPHISIIIPAYNMGEYVGQAVESILKGDFEDLEVIVIDDGSTDNTPDILASYVNPKHADFDARVQYIYQENSGKASAVNRGLKMARGSYITILDADDEFTSHSLTARYPTNGQRPDMIIGGFEVFDRRGVLGTREEPAVEDPKQLQRQLLLGYKTPFSLNTCLLSREIVEKVGMFDERLIRCQDIDYSLRCLQIAKEIQTVPATVYRYRKHRTSIKNRLRFRSKTAFHRPRVVWKNMAGPSKFLIIPYGFGMDMAKMAFELTGNYTK